MKSQNEYALERDVDVLRGERDDWKARAEKAESDTATAWTEFRALSVRAGTDKDALAATVERLRGVLNTVIAILPQGAAYNDSNRIGLPAVRSHVISALAAVRAAVLRDLADETNVFDAVQRAWLCEKADALERATASAEGVRE